MALTEPDEEVEAILSGDDDPLERKVVGLPPMTGASISYGSSIFSPTYFGGPSEPPTDEQRMANRRRESLNFALAQAKHNKWSADDIVFAARAFDAFLEHG